MTANAGYHAYATGDVLTAAQVQYNLQNQTVMYFATASARTTALSGVVVEGMVSYVPANGLEYYNGSAWVTLSTGGDITAVTAGTGLTGGGTTGAVTLNLGTTAKGDLVAGTGASTAAALTVGADGTTLVADSSTTTGLRWQAPVNVNPVLNSAFQVWQRGTSIAGNSSSTYCADRWLASRNGIAGSTFSRQVTNDTTNLPNIQYCLRAQRDSANTSTQYVLTGQSFESINSIPYAGKTVTLSFYARAGANFSAASSNLNFALQTGTGTDQNILVGYTGNVNLINTTQAITTTWTRYTATATIASTATEIGMVFYYTPVGTAGTNDYFEVTGVQLEVGSVATPFKTYAGTIQGELAACQRYYEKSFPSATAPSNGNAVSFAGNASAYTTAAARSFWIGFKANKRTSTPTITYYRNSDIATNAQWAYYSSGWATPTTTATTSYNDNGFQVELAKTSGFTANSGIIISGEWTAEAEL